MILIFINIIHKNKNKSSLYYCVNLLAQYLQFYTNMYFRKFYQDITDINKDLSKKS